MRNYSLDVTTDAAVGGATVVNNLIISGQNAMDAFENALENGQFFLPYTVACDVVVTSLITKVSVRFEVIK